jgi:hypothetical protein
MLQLECKELTTNCSCMARGNTPYELEKKAMVLARTVRKGMFEDMSVRLKAGRTEPWLA